LEISTPGRICLFGEHQDYLELPVIAMAIPLRLTLKGEKRQDQKVVINKPDLGETESFSLDNLLYTKQRDYFKSGINVCKLEGLTFSAGFDCEITSQIPIKAGCGSSSAVLVSWIHFLSQMADEPVDWSQQRIGELAYVAEVLEFKESGGMMDQYTTAVGRLIYLESKPEIIIQSLHSNLGTFVLGDSCEPKDTMGILNRCRDSRLDLIQKLKRNNPNSRVQSFDEKMDLSTLKVDELLLFRGTIKNRDLLSRALSELKKETLNHQIIGKLLTNHHQVLRDILKVSTPKIESLLDAALNAGALGGKINGSGGGGCMFAYAPENPEEVANAIELAQGKAYIIQPSEGTQIN
tara:strand:- start:100652 stop:101701 length:1050 start_codon:yes stop_codon:yes gene_type:complete